MTIKDIKDRATAGEIVICDHIKFDTNDENTYMPDDFFRRFPGHAKGLTLQDDPAADVMWVFDAAAREKCEYNPSKG